ncbi:hypothetical protein HanXRQr2_Chr08g0347861 [Helianthus annuus]|nr:hypothetical protein HanXRQr2_Chr08g0347861 [Helianthus annuus]KAJ0554243.1 hypothetical protein HanHA89_Chr08g0305481 [Helianthus annuus]KAJ0902364.1 hypothetical protein HanPSC8_Chr08g0336131 [Helianthus annuus]
MMDLTNTKKDTVSSSIRWCHDIGREHAANNPRLSKNRFPGHDEIGQNNVTLVIRDKTRVKMMEVSRKSGHATQANGEG